MICPACGHRQSDPQATYCGHCGIALVQKTPRISPAESPETLVAALHHLANIVEKRGGLPPQTVFTLRALADAESDAGRPTVVVMGEYRRGKSTIINRLLRQELLPTAPRQNDSTVRVRFGPVTTPGDDPAQRWCEATILEHLDLVDTSCWTTSNGNEVSTAVRQAMSASAIVFCIDARQALSASEREILTEELLPLVACPILLAVNFLDEVTEPSDRAEIRQRLTSFVERAGHDRLEVMLLPPGRTAQEPLFELEQWIVEKAQTPPAPQASREHRLHSLLDLIEQWSSSVSVGDDRNAALEQRDRQLAILTREHNLAVLEAGSLFREKCSRLRAGLKSVLRGLPEASHGREGLAHVVRSLRAIVNECGEHYLTVLQNSLRTDGSPDLYVMAEAIDARAGLSVETPKAPQLVVSPASRRDWRAGGVAAAALAVTLVATSWVPLLGAGLTLVAVNNWRVSKRRRDEADSAVDVEGSLQSWLVEVEPRLIDELRASADQVLPQIREQISRQFDADTSTESSVDLHESIARCRQLLSVPLEHEKPLSDN